MKKTMRIVTVSLIALIVVVGLVVTAAIVGVTVTKRAKTPAVSSAQDGNKVTTSDEEVISKVAEAVSPSVVSIVAETATRTMFGVAQQQAAGTGVIVSSDGYVLTNKHVVDGVSALKVIMSDGTTYDKVKLVGTDPLNDIAYLQIQGAKNLPAATLGDSSTVRVGQGVVAIGNSLGQYQNTVTSGIISGKGRPVTAGNESGSSSETLTDLLQTDAAINPGNSGGPLLNRAGQVIGINTAVAANAQGIGFAIPINATKGALKMVLAGKGVQRAYIGLRYIQLTPEIAKQLKLTVTQGAYVPEEGTSVQAGGPADRAGLRAKDILTKINGRVIGQQGGVSSLIGESAPGDTIDITYVRDGREQTARVTLAAYPTAW